VALIDLAWDHPLFGAAEILRRRGIADGWKLIGWEEAGEVIACTAVSRCSEALELQFVVVAERERGRGIGRALVLELAEVVNAAALVADVDQGASGFYRACGFTLATGDGSRAGNPVRCTLELDTVAVPESSPPLTLSAVETAVRDAWSADTASDPATWTAQNPARDHCDVTALFVREILGGEILIANVILDGRRVERHAWNRLSTGVTIDLTRSQFRNGEQFGRAKVAEPVGFHGSTERYARFAARARAALARRADVSGEA
jgi:GNAT superfamily N-acetyltransferase